jgi:hypothetical protein
MRTKPRRSQCDFVGMLGLFVAAHETTIVSAAISGARKVFIIEVPPENVLVIALRRSVGGRKDLNRLRTSR